jgi:hypothetical protein
MEILYYDIFSPRLASCSVHGAIGLGVKAKAEKKGATGLNFFCFFSLAILLLYCCCSATFTTQLFLQKQAQIPNKHINRAFHLPLILNISRPKKYNLL